MFLKRLWEYWKKFGRLLGKIQTTIILAIIYYFIFTPVGLIKKIFSLGKKRNTYWIDLEQKQYTLKEVYQQY